MTQRSRSYIRWLPLALMTVFNAITGVLIFSSLGWLGWTIFLVAWCPLTGFLMGAWAEMRR